MNAIVKVVRNCADDDVYNGILKYITHLIETKDEGLLRAEYDTNHEMYYIDPSPHEKTFFMYNEHRMYIDLCKEGEPQAMDGYMKFPRKYEHLVLGGPSRETIINFIKDSAKHFQELQWGKTREDKISLLTNRNHRFHFECHVNRRSEESLYLPKKDYDAIVADMNLYFNSKDTYEKLEIPYARTYMLHGRPGTGKTSLIRVIATKYNLRIATLDFDRDMSNRCLTETLRNIPPNTILVLEDIDSLFDSETRESCSDTCPLTFSGLLNALDGISNKDSLLIFMTTNFMDRIFDEALKRRLDYILELKDMQMPEIERMQKKFFPDLPFDKTLYTGRKVTPCILQKFYLKNIHKTLTEEGLDSIIGAYTPPSKLNHYT